MANIELATCSIPRVLLDRDNSSLCIGIRKNRQLPLRENCHPSIRIQTAVQLRKLKLAVMRTYADVESNHTLGRSDAQPGNLLVPRIPGDPLDRVGRICGGDRSSQYRL